MGIYTQCVMLFGVVIGEKAHKYLTESKEYDKNFWCSRVYSLDKTHWVIGNKDNYYTFKQWLDSPLEDKELKQGYVAGSEIKTILAKDPTTKFLLENEAARIEISVILSFLKLNSELNIKDDLVPNWWFYEIGWSSYDPEVDSSSVGRRILINFDK